MTQNLNENVSNQVNRMKAMMTYGMKTESKPYNSVEFERVGADGKKYAIIREGSKFHIKVSDKKNPTKSDYDYINGFANHRQNMFESYANALKHFEMKMTSLNEAYNKKGNVATWNVNGRDEILAEASNKMRLEIARQREIMKNAAIISEGKNGVDKTQASNIEKNNIRMTKPKTGQATGQGGDIFDEKPEKEMLDMQKDNIKGKQQPVVENVEDEFMDAPLSNVNVASNNSGEGAGQTNVMGGAANGSLGEEEDVEDDVDVTVDTDMDSEDDDLSGDIDVDAVEDDELEEFPEEDEEEFEDDSLTAQNQEEEDDITSLRAEIDSLRSTLDAIADKLGVNEFDEDEPLYDDDADEDFDTDAEDDVEYEIEADDEENDSDLDDDDTEIEDDDTEVFESVHYRKVMLEGKKLDALKKGAKKIANAVGTKIRHAYEDYQDGNEIALHTPNWMNASDEDWEEHEKFSKNIKDRRKAKRDAEKKKKENVDETVLHDFGKHPRFKKEPMTYPTPNMAKKNGQYEEGADEDNTNKPYATEIGDPTPFGDGEKVKKAVNSIAEAIIRQMKLKND